MKLLIYYTMSKNGKKEKEYDVIDVPYVSDSNTDNLIASLKVIQKIESYWKARGYYDITVTDVSDYLED